ncbi:hypothetical protein BGZ81_009642 [Podila clonocystis]|nr:hypothetical protein BGZ81_009642 [Podila clonocystis]
MAVEQTEKKPMQTKNKVLIGVVSALVIVGIALGVYFGTKNNGNKTGDTTNDKSHGGLPTPTPTTSGAAPSPTPTGTPAHGNGTMINGVLFPYYTLTGEAPAPVGVPGMVYTTCKTPGTFSISFDDGPSIYTNELLDLLDKENIKVTFFVNGNNQQCIYDPKVQTVLKRAYNSGHQIASHTWSHPQLTKQTVEGINLEMTKLEKAFEDVLGVVPRYMRPPYGDGTFGNGNADDQKVQGTLKNLGYVITTWDIATGDADIDDNTIPHKLTDDALMKSEQNQYTSVVNAAAKGATHMALHHDTYERTVKLMAPWAINYVKSLGYKIVPVATCLGDEDPRTWYKKIGPAAATTPAVCQK